LLFVVYLALIIPSVCIILIGFLVVDLSLPYGGDNTNGLFSDPSFFDKWFFLFGLFLIFAPIVIMCTLNSWHIKKKLQDKQRNTEIQTEIHNLEK
jgi:hypothetical protein